MDGLIKIGALLRLQMLAKVIKSQLPQAIECNL